MKSLRAADQSRRAFFRMTIAAGTLAGASALLPALASTERRIVSFRHTHTGESLRAEYFVDGIYQPEVLSAVNHLLRDFRTGDIHSIDPQLLDLLSDLALLTGVEAPYEVISAYRSPATNAMLHDTTGGVAEHSQHMLGKAIDIRLPAFSSEHLGALARMLGRGGVGVYLDSNFVHVDTGPVRVW